MTVTRLFVALVAGVVWLANPVDVSAQWRGGPPGKGGPPSFDRLLDAFDDNEDGKLEEDEVPPAVWRRLSSADANGDGMVTRKEFENYRKKLLGGK